MTGLRIPVTVRSAVPVAHDVRALRLARRDGGPLPTFAPGSHIDLHLAPGLVRQYSLCGDIDDATSYIIAVKLEPASRGGSRTVHEDLAPGVHLDISAPRNNFPLDATAPHTVLIAGGIGITPIISMARVLARAGKRFEFHYFARSAEHAAFKDEIGGPTLAGAGEGHFGLTNEQTVGKLYTALANRLPGAQLYLCGPAGFMDLVRGVAADQGWPLTSVHLEYFKADASTVATSGGAISVQLARSGISVPVPTGVPIIDALRAAGIKVETSCEQGVCGTCVTRVLGGVPEHHDLFLTDQEKSRGDCMAICVSRSLTPQLVLDL